MTPNPQLQKWLGDFAHGKNAEESFRRAVEHLKPLIFQTAFRKSRDEELAKDITQTVFLRLAKKASSLSRHPAILGWVHETTRTEAFAALRSQARRKKREEAAMKDVTQYSESSREALEIIDGSMRCLSAAEKELVLMKYFEDRSYQSITAMTGRSESAEKMRLKRALEKMAGWLSRKGITLSISGLATILGTEMAKGAPPISIDCGAIASSTPPLSPFSRALTTMSPGQLSLATGFIVMAAAAQPLASAWRDYHDQRKALAQLNPDPTSPRISQRRTVGASGGDQDTISDIIDRLTNIPKDRYSREVLSGKLIDAVEFHNPALLHEVDQILAQMEIEEIGELARMINTGAGRNLYGSVIEHLLKFLPQDWDPARRIHWTIENNSKAEVPRSLFSTWIFEAQGPASDWLIQQTRERSFPFTGFQNDFEGMLWERLMCVLNDKHGGTKGLAASIFLDLPNDTRKRLSNFRSDWIPRSLIGLEYGLDCTLKIIKETHDASKRHWISALVDSKHAPEELSEFDQWLQELDLNERETKSAVHFFNAKKK